MSSTLIHIRSLLQVVIKKVLHISLCVLSFIERIIAEYVVLATRGILRQIALLCLELLVLLHHLNHVVAELLVRDLTIIIAGEIVHD